MNAGTIVLVRTYSAGVHYGELIERNGKEVQLRGARRIWSWVGANSLNEIAISGCGIGSRISVPADNTLTEAVELLTMTPNAIAVMGRLSWGK